MLEQISALDIITSRLAKIKRHYSRILPTLGTEKNAFVDRLGKEE